MKYNTKTIYSMFNVFCNTIFLSLMSASFKQFGTGPTKDWKSCEMKKHLLQVNWQQVIVSCLGKREASSKG